jgi:hypothetical protein
MTDGATLAEYMNKGAATGVVFRVARDRFDWILAALTAANGEKGECSWPMSLGLIDDHPEVVKGWRPLLHELTSEAIQERNARSA